MYQSYQLQYRFCGHITPIEYRYCPGLFTTRHGFYVNVKEATIRFCDACYLDPEIGLASSEYLVRFLGGTINPIPLDVATHGDIWGKIRESEVLNSMYSNNFGALIGMLRGGDEKDVD